MPMMIFTSSLNCDSAFLCPGYMCHSPGPSTLADVPPTLHLTFPLGSCQVGHISTCHLIMEKMDLKMTETPAC